MDYQQIIAELRKIGASDLHLEPGLPPTARIDGDLKPFESDPLEGRETQAMARALLSDKDWNTFLERRSFDISCILGGVRCRVSFLRTYRGIGLAVRLLSTFQPTLERLNLHPGLADLVKRRHGLIVITGSTGSGKSSTLAALIHEINSRESAHIVTIESPIEYFIRPRRSFVRQREVGRDTPSFERALLDAMRQDPDVIMVGEMRERETVRLTLNAAETGQLVLSTLHASNTAEAVQRMVSAFPPEIQGSVCAQLADGLIAVIAQRLKYHEDHSLRIPSLEIMVATHPVKNLIRQGQFYKLSSALETGYGEGNWTFRRYQEWINSRDGFFVPTGAEGLDAGPKLEERSDMETVCAEGELPENTAMAGKNSVSVPEGNKEVSEDVIVIDEPEEKSLTELIKKIDRTKKKGDE